MPLSTKEQQSLLAFRQQREDALDAAYSSGREQEGNFVKGAAIGVGTGLVAGAAGLVDLGSMLLSNTHQSAGLADKVIEYGSDVAEGIGPGAKAGFEMGNIAAVGLPDPTDALFAIGAMSLPLRKLDEIGDEELIKLIRQQAADAKAWQKQGGTRVTPQQREALEITTGDKIDDIRPQALGERNELAFPSKQSEPIVEVIDEHPTIVGDKENEQMLNYTQGQHNPGATAGLRPQAPAPSGSTMEDVSMYAGRKMAHWRKGFDPEQFKAHVEASLSARATAAAKGKKGSPPEFWVYDASKKEILVLKRDKNEKLVVKSAKNADPFQRYKDGAKKGKVVRDSEGRAVMSDKIDYVVDSYGRERLSQEIYKAWIDKLDTL